MCLHRQPPQDCLINNAVTHGVAASSADASGQKVMHVPGIGLVPYEETDFFDKVARNLREAEFEERAEELPDISPDGRGA